MSKPTSLIAAIISEPVVKQAHELRWSDRGRLIAIETPSALYYGYLSSIIFHTHGDVALGVKRDDFEANCKLQPSAFISLHPTERDPNRRASHDDL